RVSAECRFFSVIYYDTGGGRRYLVFFYKGAEGFEGRPWITLFEFHLVRPEIIFEPFLFSYLAPGRLKKKRPRPEGLVELPVLIEYIEKIPRIKGGKRMDRRVDEREGDDVPVHQVLEQRLDLRL